MINWFVAHTNPSKEVIAQQHLLDQGYDVYLPRFKKTRRHARKVEDILAPLFPRYIFVGMDLETARWRSINGTRGVSYLLTNDDCPAIVPSHIIQNLKNREISEGILPIDSLIAFTKGDKVRILDGVFQDQVATFQMLDGKQRVHLLLSFIGREIKISLPNYAVEAA